jgi:hypothetical protein
MKFQKERHSRCTAIEENERNENIFSGLEENAKGEKIEEIHLKFSRFPTSFRALPTDKERISPAFHISVSEPGSRG